VRAPPYCPLNVANMYEIYYTELLSWRFTMWNFQSFCRSQWPRGLSCRSAAARLLGLWVQIPPGAWMSVVTVVCCQVEVSASGWSLVQRSPTECGVSKCDPEASKMRWFWSTRGCCAMGGGFNFLRGTLRYGKNTYLALFRYLHRRRLSSEIISIRKVLCGVAHKLFL